jgi:hypothetical protein
LVFIAKKKKKEKSVGVMTGGKTGEMLRLFPHSFPHIRMIDADLKGQIA